MNFIKIIYLYRVEAFHIRSDSRGFVFWNWENYIRTKDIRVLCDIFPLIHRRLLLILHKFSVMYITHHHHQTTWFKKKRERWNIVKITVTVGECKSVSEWVSSEYSVVKLVKNIEETSTRNWSDNFLIHFISFYWYRILIRLESNIG